MTRGWFVTGTDTGVGKTVVSCAIARGLRDRGIDLGVMKPVETGVEEAGPQDAQKLRAAAGVDDALDEICPFQFALPAAPNVAAAAENRAVDLDILTSGFERLASRHETMLVEGAGGLLVPVTDEVDMAQLAQRLGLDVIVVARMALGTINHSLLTLREIERRGVALAGVVLSESDGALSKADEANLQHLRRALGDRVLAEIRSTASPETALIDGRTLDRLLQRD
ncbi:MAG: dethiobiotin synthase [Myxococcota bacterium]|jgi:dethiobiotin synthetase|nr:dethiobiotin synthase [Myxococcota bacterium]